MGQVLDRRDNYDGQMPSGALIPVLGRRALESRFIFVDFGYNTSLERRHIQSAFSFSFWSYHSTMIIPRCTHRAHKIVELEYL